MDLANRGCSRLRLRAPGGTEVVGTIADHPGDRSVVFVDGIGTIEISGIEEVEDGDTDFRAIQVGWHIENNVGRFEILEVLA